MKKLLIVLLAALTAFTLCIPAFASENAPANDPALGSWKLGEVMEIREGQEAALLAKEENQSLYGSGKSIFTFDEDGAASCAVFDGADMADLAATWTMTAQNEYTFTEEGGFTYTFTYNKEDDTLHRTFAEEDRTLDFVFHRAIVGQWKLDTVLAINPGDAPDVLDPAANQSLYSAAENILALNADGTVAELVKNGPNEYEETGTWEMTAPDQYTLYHDESGAGTEMEYFRIDDTLLRDWVDDSPEAAFPHLRFILTRAE